MASNTRSTKLEAVNVILTVVGESETNTLTGTVPYEVSLAETILDETIREMCQDSYVFNTETDITLTPDVSDNINVPTNYIQIRGSEEDYVIRSGLLYSMRAKTDTFDNEIVVDVIYLLEYEDIPEAAKRYCNIRAARIYADRMVGSKDIRAFTQIDEIEAKAKLASYEHGVDRLNMLNDNSSVSYIQDRRI